MQTLPQSNPAVTVADGWRAFLEDFAELVRNGVRSAATLCTHRSYIRRLSSHLNGSTPLVSVDEEVIQSLARAVSTGRRTDASGARIPTSNSTVAKFLATVSGMLKSAKRRRWIERVPEFPRISYRPNRKTDHFRNLDEVEALCATLPPARADWIRLAVFTGQHASDVERMRAYVDADPFASPPWFVRRNTKNRKAPKRMAMPAPLARRLRARFKHLGLGFGDPIVPPWDKDNRGDMLRRRRARLGLMKITATACRHTFATWVANRLRAITPGLVEALGHSSPRMAEQTYAHALPPGLAEVAEALRRPPRAAKSSRFVGTVPAKKRRSR